MIVRLLGATPGALRFLALALILGSVALGGGLGPARRRRLYPFFLASALIASLCGVLDILARSAELAEMTSHGNTAWTLVSRTHFGRVWAIGEVAALGLTAAAARSRASAWSLGAFAAVALLAPPFASHSYALDSAWPALAAHELHFLCVALWTGGLLTLLVTERAEAGSLVFTFSRRAPFLVGGAVASGTWLALDHVASWPRLLATPYGQLLLAKIALLGGALAAAAWLRWRILPTLAAPGAAPPRAALARLLAVELAFAAAIVLVAAELASTVPAAHDEVTSWWLPFRFSVTATWPEPWVAERVAAGLGVGIAYAAASAGVARRGRVSAACAVGILGAGFAAAIGLPPLAVPAYPGTYWTPQVAYHVVSVAHGRTLYRLHCVSCHGLAGRGDGPLARSLPKRPANLTEPHTAYHTAGDMFWWLTYGIPQSKMPPFADSLSEDDRWDVINYLRAFASGYQARLLSARISPGHPWLGSVDFNYTTTSGKSGLLRDFREHAAVLLVLYTPGSSSEARLAELRRLAPDLGARGVEILALPVRPEGVDAERLAPPSVVGEEAGDIVTTYALFRRTFSDPGNDADDDLPSHLELLIDRFGYIRARWRPDADPVGWNDVELLRTQARELAAEPRILPPPDEHVH